MPEKQLGEVAQLRDGVHSKEFSYRGICAVRTIKPTSPNREVPPAPENKALASVVNCGCGMLFLSTGVLPLLAWLNILPRGDFFGDAPPFLVIVASLPFAVVGLYFISNAGMLLFNRRRLSERVLLNLGMFFLAIPFHYWLFFGSSDKGSVTGISLPGGLDLFFFDNGKLSFVVGKIAVALLVIAMDLYLVSELLGLGWFVSTDSSPDEYPDDERDD